MQERYNSGDNQEFDLCIIGSDEVFNCCQDAPLFQVFVVDTSKGTQDPQETTARSPHKKLPNRFPAHFLYLRKQGL